MCVRSCGIRRDIANTLKLSWLEWRCGWNKIRLAQSAIAMSVIKQLILLRSAFLLLLLFLRLFCFCCWHESIVAAFTKRVKIIPINNPVTDVLRLYWEMFLWFHFETSSNRGMHKRQLVRSGHGIQLHKSIHTVSMCRWNGAKARTKLIHMPVLPLLIDNRYDWAIIVVVITNFKLTYIPNYSIRRFQTPNMLSKTICKRKSVDSMGQIQSCFHINAKSMRGITTYSDRLIRLFLLLSWI